MVNYNRNIDILYDEKAINYNYYIYIKYNNYNLIILYLYG